MSIQSARGSEPVDEALAHAIDAACRRIAPTWPLDRFIAVNPLWGYIEGPLRETAVRVESLSGARLSMPRTGYAEYWRSGQLREHHLRTALARSGSGTTLDELVAHLQTPEDGPVRRELVTDVADRFRDTVHGMSWCDFVAHTISQFCAAYFDDGQAQLGPDRRLSLYACWRARAHVDLSPRLLMGLSDYGSLLAELPEDPRELIARATSELGIPSDEREAYFCSLLMRVNGWAAWCAYRRWTARLAGRDDHQIVDLLALRLAWEWMLFRAVAHSMLPAHWKSAVDRWPLVDRAVAESRRLDWILQDALELAYQSPLVTGLARAAAVKPAIDAGGPPAVQMVFCIDVRSEVFRRAIETITPRVATLGFAGFFGAPIEYQPLGGESARPQLPGLLAPALRATDAGAPVDLAERRRGRLALRDAWKRFRQSSVSSFSLVESMGLVYAVDLVANTLALGRPNPHPERAGLRPEEKERCRPRLAGPAAGGELDRTARTNLAAGILRAMSLGQGFARLVVLVGHGSETVNNPHAAGLDCGACCGQTGEVNARVVAALFNDEQVRTDLIDRGIEIPATTRFVAALHNTTLDRVAFFDTDELPTTHSGDLARLERWLEEAGALARRERSASLGLGGLEGEELERAIRMRSRDWSEVRPEWGLANNAAFVVAPRERSRALNLRGRSFLHEYRWEQDQGFPVLELIMTAPMVVTHWINFQYYASTVDNRRFGSGNKVLHNVVGGRLGVFEGNGGDLRIGLSLQSLHDGERWQHTPLRLSVFIEAPRDAIDAVLAKHAHVRQLVENEWIHLFQIDTVSGGIQARSKDGWRLLAPAQD